jgi:hypothetical protein
MQVEYLESDYDPYLGLYKTWVQGDPTQQVECLYCMSAFQLYHKFEGYVHQSTYHKYAEYLRLSVDSIMQSTDWYVRIYIDESVMTPLNPDSELWISILQGFQQYDHVQIICIKMPRYFNEEHRHHQGLLAVLFRYLALFDKNTSIMLFRDIDNIWTEQHQYFVDEWLNRGDQVCLYLNQNYGRQEIMDLTETSVVLNPIFYKTILSGLWNYHKPLGDILQYTIWAKMFGYIESYTDFVFNAEYTDYVYYGVRFAYGFDELALTRVVIPIFIQNGCSFYAIPIKIYDRNYYQNMFAAPILKKFYKSLSDSDTLQMVEHIMDDNYWNMDFENSGLSQYIVCMLTNIFFRIITQQSKYYISASLINALKTQIYPTILLMGVGLFTFQNFDRYNWYPNKTSDGGSSIVRKFIRKNQQLTLGDWTANSDMSNDGNGSLIPSPPPPPYYYNI